VLNEIMFVYFRIQIEEGLSNKIVLSTSVVWPRNMAGQIYTL